MYKCLHLTAKIDKKDSTAPKWILLFKAGWNKLADGTKFLIDQTSFELIKTDIASRGNDVHFDYEHASLEMQPAPAAGWIKEFKWIEAGINIRVEWTSKASDYIVNKEYRYFSPVFYIRKSDSRVCGLDSVALTNRPLTTNLTPILARMEAGRERQNNKEDEMDRKKLIAALGLEENATDADVLTAIAKLEIKIPEVRIEKEIETKEVIPEKITAALGIKKDDDVSTVVASIHALKQGSDKSVSREEFNKLQAKLAEKEATDAVDAALKIGKISPAQKDWAMDYAKEDLKGFTTFVAKAPVVVPVNALPGKKADENDGELTENDLRIAKMMDVSAEDIKKYGALA